MVTKGQQQQHTGKTTVEDTSVNPAVTQNTAE
jgi:hypothetical protein